MLRVTIDLVPHGDEEDKRCLGTMEICLKGISPETPDRGVDRARYGWYRFSIFKWGPGRRAWRKGDDVGPFDRRRRGPWDLLLMCLRQALEGR